MSTLTPEGQSIVDDAAARHGFSSDAVTHMLIALAQGGGTQAQFNHFEFGGMGQWSMGGMTMIGDMFNNMLKGRVDGLCADLSNAMASSNLFRPAQSQNQSSSYQGQFNGGQSQSQGGGMGGGMGASLFVPGSGYGNWWPEDLGQPSSSGAQNDLKYAYFPSTQRLAILLHGKTTVYDTGPHQISGVSQQQSGDQSLTLTSQMGTVRLFDLPQVSGPVSEQAQSAPQPEVQANTPAPAPEPLAKQAPPQSNQPAPSASVSDGADTDAIFAKLEKLGALRDKGIISDEEFASKKTELLSRI